MPWKTLDPKRYRIFKAEPLLVTDHHIEVGWHKKHLKKLHQYKHQPEKFHNHHGHEHKTYEEKERHFLEHVHHSIPFHQQIMNEHMQRIELLQSFFTTRQLRKLRSFIVDRSSIPDFLVFDSMMGDVFFANKNPSTAQEIWAHEVEEKKLATVKDLSKL